MFFSLVCVWFKYTSSRFLMFLTLKLILEKIR